MTRERESPETGGRRPRYAVVAEGSAVGLFFPLAIVAGYFVGKWVGGWLHLGEWAAIAGAALGVAAAFLNLWRFLKRLEQK